MAKGAEEVDAGFPYDDFPCYRLGMGTPIHEKNRPRTKLPTYDVLSGWAAYCNLGLWAAFAVFMKVSGPGPHPEFLWFLPPFVVGVAFLALVIVRPDFSVKRSRKQHLDRFVAFLRELLSLWPLAALGVGLWLAAQVFMWITGAILSLPIWALVGLGLAVLALIWFVVGTADMKAGSLFAAAWLLMMTPVALMIWWFTR